MAQHEEKNCPRCNKLFECKCGSIDLCQCSTITLPDRLSKQLRNEFTDCLCIQCLREIQLTNSISRNKTNNQILSDLILHR